MTDDLTTRSTVAACRAALEQACDEVFVYRDVNGGIYVRLDDAAACMARALEAGIRAAVDRSRDPQSESSDWFDWGVRAALAAAQEPDDAR